MTGKIFGELGETPEEFERRRIRELLKAADDLNERQADIPMREDFGAEGESYDTPEMTHDAIARMAAARGKTVRMPPPPPPLIQRAAPPMPTRRLDPPPPSPRASGYPPSAQVGVPALNQDMRQEFREMAVAVISELGRGLQQQFADLKEDIQANTQLLAVMNAPMEAITDSHERASESFETLRREIASIGGSGSSPAIEKLTEVLDTAGLSEAQSRAERRFEDLAKAIEGALQATRIEMKSALQDVSKNMVSVLHLLERLQAREVREMKRRATVETPEQEAARGQGPA